MPYEQRPIGSLCDPDHPSMVMHEPVYVAPWTCASDGKVAAGILADGAGIDLDHANVEFLRRLADIAPPDDAMVTTAEHLVEWMGLGYAGPTKQPCPKCNGKPCLECKGYGKAECRECGHDRRCPHCHGRRCPCGGDGFVVKQSKVRPANLLGFTLNRGIVANALSVLPPGEVLVWSKGGALDPIHFRHAAGWAVVMPMRWDLDGVPVYEPGAACGEGAT